MIGQLYRGIDRFQGGKKFGQPRFQVFTPGFRGDQDHILGADIISGNNNEPGAYRKLTLQDGPSFDEELLEWDSYNRMYTYRVIDPAPLPIKNYQSTMTVMQLAPGVSNVTWISSYENASNGEMSDDELIAFLNGVYQAGLEQVKGMVE